jgi:hypothetical protein
MVRAPFCEAASPIYIVIPADHLLFHMRATVKRSAWLLLD